VLQIQGISSFMMKRLLYIITIVLTVPFGYLKINAQQSSFYDISRMPFNTDVFSEISPVLVKDGILFCSDRRFSIIEDRTAYDGHRLYNIYLAGKTDSLKWKKPEEIIGGRSSLFNNGPFCLAPDGKTVYFTSEIETGVASKKKNFKNHNGIFIADLSITTLDSIHPFKYNNPQYEVGQPSISSDGRYLFFASDMPGGQGKTDIYYCELIDGEWSGPVNLGPGVNSPAVDNYPFMHSSGKLYFSSDRQGGIGKLDIYYTSLRDSDWEEPVLLPEPINSPSDDFAFIAEDNLKTGYFASDRRTSDDIFKFASTIIRKASCSAIVENNYCYRFLEENAAKYDTMPFRFEWKFGDGTKADGPVVEHCFSGPGKYIVQLDVVNLITKETMFNEKTDTLLLYGAEQPDITGPDTVSTGERILLNAGSTYLPGWKIASYYWNYGDETADTGLEVGKIYQRPGKYNVQLIVTEEPEPGGMAREACVSKNILVIRKQ
jgi:Tol biopolymer transport system component